MKLVRVFSHAHRPAVTARTVARCSWAAAVLAVIAFAGPTGAKAQIIEYDNNVFTNNGQSTVAGFAAKLKKAETALQAVDGLAVYVGHHGDLSGAWCADFDKDETRDVLAMATLFPKATLHWITKTTALTNTEIQAAVTKGKVFFTWCDSDTKVKSAVGTTKMPKLVKEYK